MSTQINIGGPAFPSKLTGPCEAYGLKADETQTIEFAGMTLRDYFAAKAMHAVLSTPKLLQATSDGIAEMSYEMADAMLKARNQ